jgi:hypothetical protein
MSSIQRVVSDGNLTTIPLSIEFYEQNDIYVFVGGTAIASTPYTYVWSAPTTITITPAVASGVEVLIRRVTDSETMRHVFNTGAVFSETSMDENFDQLLKLTQEAVEGSVVEDIFNDIDMHGYRIKNVADPIDIADAINNRTHTELKDRVQAIEDKGGMLLPQFGKLVTREEVLPVTVGQTVFTLTKFGFVAGSGALALYYNGIRLHESTFTENQNGLGFTLNFIPDVVGEILAVGSAEGSTVTQEFNYNELRNYAGARLRVYVYGRSTQKDGGSGYFYADLNDTTSPDNDGTCLVNGTVRWKRDYKSTVLPQWFGATGDGATDDTVAINNCIASSQGKLIRFPAGTYIYNGSATLTNGTNLIGDGRNTTIIKCNIAAPSNLFDCAGYASGIRSMRFIAGVTQTTGNWVKLSGIESFIDDFYMTGDFNGVNMTGNVAKITNGRFQDAAAGASRIIAAGGDNSQLISDVLMGAQSPANIAAAGIQVTNSSALTLNNVSVIQQGIGLNITSNVSNLGVYSIKATNCFFDNCTRAMAITLTGSGNAVRFHFVSCWFGSSTLNNVTLSNNGTGVLEGITFTACDFVNSLQSGFATGGTGNVNDVSLVNCFASGNLNGMFFTNANNCRVVACTIGYGSGLPSNTNNGIVLESTTSSMIVTDCIIKGNGTNQVVNNGTNNTIVDNDGYRTKTAGTSLIASGVSSVVINHNLPATPLAQDLELSLLANQGTTPLYIDSTTINATSFTVRTASNAAANINFAWKAAIFRGS